jgi:hypothetical protein
MEVVLDGLEIPLSRFIFFKELLHIRDCLRHAVGRQAG